MLARLPPGARCWLSGWVLSVATLPAAAGRDPDRASDAAAPLLRLLPRRTAR